MDPTLAALPLGHQTSSRPLIVCAFGLLVRRVLAKPNLVVECELALKQRLLFGFGLVQQQVEVPALVDTSQPLVGSSMPAQDETRVVLEEEKPHKEGPYLRVLLFLEALV